MTRRTRLLAAGGSGLLIATAAVAGVWLWPQGGVTPGVGEYARLFNACQRALFDIDIRAGTKVEFLPSTVWHQAQGDRVDLGGVAILRYVTDRVERNNYECNTYQGDLTTSSIRPVSSSGATIDRR